MLEITTIQNQLYREWQAQEQARAILFSNLLDMVDRHFLPKELMASTMQAANQAVAEAKMLYHFALMSCDRVELEDDAYYDDDPSPIGKLGFYSEDSFHANY